MFPVAQRHMMCHGALLTFEDITQKMQDTGVSSITQKIPANKIAIKICVYIRRPKKRQFVLPNLNT